MADSPYCYARHVRGNARERRVPAAADAEVKAGDFLALVSGGARRASTLPDLGTLADNQAAAHGAFLGVAMDAKRAGEARDVLAAAGGVFRYPVAALDAAHDAGECVGAAEGAGAVGLADQQVSFVATAGLAFGRLARPAAVGDVFIEVEIAAVLTGAEGGAQPPV